MQLPAEKCCSRCHSLFVCGPAAGETQCWCETLPPVTSVADEPSDCLCPACLTEAIEKRGLARSENIEERETVLPRLIEGADYYVEGSTIVFTAGYLRRRGYCCKSGCRHCPYGAE